MATDRLQIKFRRTSHSTQFTIGIVIAVAAVLGIEYALQQITQTPPTPEPVSSIDPAKPTSQSDDWAAVPHGDPPGFATVRDAQPTGPFSDAHSIADVHYFPVRGEATSDSQIAKPAQSSLPVQKSAPADHPNSNGPPVHPAPARLAAPVPDRATPIRPGTDPHDEQLRSIIRQELPLASTDECEIWLNALRGLAPAMVRQLLRLRRVIREDGPPIAAENSNRPDSVRPIGPTRNKTTFSDSFSAFKPVIEPLPASTVGRMVLPTHPVPQRLRPALNAIRLARDALLGNIANANAIGFKRRRVFFENIPSAQLQHPSPTDRNEKVVLTGLGIQVSEIRCDHSPGPLQTTRRSLDLAIDGDGFFQIQTGHNIMYTRSGDFQLNAHGSIVLKIGGRQLLLEPTITVPADATSIVVTPFGIVSVDQPGLGEPMQIGMIQLAGFINPAGLEPRGRTLFARTKESGTPRLDRPGWSLGKLRQFCLEQSNVRLNEELQSLRRLQQQLLAIRQAAMILSGSGGFNTPPTTEGSPNPSPLVREPVPSAEPDGPKLSQQPAPQKR